MVLALAAVSVLAVPITPANAGLAQKPKVPTAVPEATIDRGPGQSPISIRTYTTLHQAADRIEAVAQSRTGFGSVAFTRAFDGVVLYWKGPIPSVVSDLVQQLRTFVSITVVGAAYSEKELLAERDRLMARSGAGSGPDIYVAGPRPDDSGLDVVVARGSLARAAAAGTTVINQLDPVVKTWVSEGDAPIASARQSDTSPYFGGAQVLEDGGLLCSTGFRVKSGATEYMVSAWHCTGGSPFVVITYPNTAVRVVGNAQLFNQSKDIELIGDPVTAYAGRFYTGPYNGNVSQGIMGVHTPAVNDFVCMEGGFTGNVCSNLVTKVNQSVNYGGNLGTVTGLSLAVNQLAISGSGEGDSGGPVASFDATGNLTIIDGMLEGLNPPFGPCHGDPSVNRICSANVFFTPVSAIISAFGVTVG